MKNLVLLLTVVFGTLSLISCNQTNTSLNKKVSQETMIKIYNEIRTPYKYGVVIEPPEGKQIDCPNVFKHNDKWYMLYVQLEKEPKEGYSTQLAWSEDLLHWEFLGTVGERGNEGDWDRANVSGGVALIDITWGGTYELERFNDRYWFSYLGGSNYGYEVKPLSIGLASTHNPSIAIPWKKLPEPIMTPLDSDARANLETSTLYKSFIFHDKKEKLGYPYVMFYNAKGVDENIFIAVSDNMIDWKRYGQDPVIENKKPEHEPHNSINGDPQIIQMGNYWVMIYFGAFWKPGAFNTFAVSSDMVNWTKWGGEDLVKASKKYDTPYAHKPWIIKHEGIVYHFYCAVDKNNRRTIAVATSKKLKESR